MKLRKLRKDRMRYAPKYLRGAPGRKDGVYYDDYCCKGCFWDWGVGFAGNHLYKHEYTESNYLGALKKYWKSSAMDRNVDTEDLDNGVSNESRTI